MSLHPRPDLMNYFLQMLDLIASRGTCIRRKVAAIITDQKGHILSTGYNGVPSGVLHCIGNPCPGVVDKPGDSSNCMAIHAEQNALLQCQNLDKAYFMYCSCTPCFTCAKMIANTNIKMIVCKERYADQRGVEVLQMVMKIVLHPFDEEHTSDAGKPST